MAGLVDAEVSELLNKEVRKLMKATGILSEDVTAKDERMMRSTRHDGYELHASDGVKLFQRIETDAEDLPVTVTAEQMAKSLAEDLWNAYLTYFGRPVCVYILEAPQFHVVKDRYTAWMTVSR